MWNEKARRWEVWEYETKECKKIYEVGLEDTLRFVKVLELMVHYHEIEVYHMSNQFSRILN